MRSLKNILTAILVLSWASALMAAAPAPGFSARISLALPAQNIDFSDLDLRDENNQPISAPQIRRRFEDVLNQNLNRMLIENLTPLRRAWLALSSRELDAFADWIGRAGGAVERMLWTAVNGGTRIAVVFHSALMDAASQGAHRPASRANEFYSLAFLLIASTRLLC